MYTNNHYTGKDGGPMLLTDKAVYVFLYGRKFINLTLREIKCSRNLHVRVLVGEKEEILTHYIQQVYSNFMETLFFDLC
jgi:hypothetical protein